MIQSFSAQNLVFLRNSLTRYKVTLIEISTQAQLCSSLPKLYNDLKENNMNTLQQFFVTYCHVEVRKPSTDTELNLLDLICIDAAYVQIRQHNYIFFQLNNLFNFPRAILLLSVILLHLDKEPLTLTSETKISGQKPYVMTWYYLSLHNFQIQ